MSDRDEPQIAFGPRGEGIIYYRDRRTLHVDLTWSGGPRLYPDRDLHRWPNGEPLSEAEKRRVFGDVLAFVRGGTLARLLRKPLAVVVNDDDPDRALWERFALEAGVRVERTSDDADLARDRDSYLVHLRAGRVLRINHVELRTEADLDAFLAARHHAHRAVLRRQRAGPTG